MSYINQRKFPRADFPCYLTLWLDNKFDTLLTKTINISAAGVLVVIERSLKIGAKVDVKIEFFDGVSFECCGTIVRCVKEEHKPSDYSVAISFEGLDESKLAFLKNLVLTLFGFEKKI